MGMTNSACADPPAKSTGGADKEDGRGVEQDGLKDCPGFEVSRCNGWLVRRWLVEGRRWRKVCSIIMAELGRR